MLFVITVLLIVILFSIVLIIYVYTLMLSLHPTLLRMRLYCIIYELIQEGKSPLYIACARGNHMVATLLSKHIHQKFYNEDPTYTHPSLCSSAMSIADAQGNSCLYVACYNNQPRILNILLKYQEYIDLLNMPNIYGNSVLYICCVYNNIELVKVLTQFKLNLNMGNKV